MAHFAIGRSIGSAVLVVLPLAFGGGSSAAEAPDSAAATALIGPEDGTSWQEKTSVDVEPSTETWTGVDATSSAAAAYTGVTWSPFGNLRQDGFRLRGITGQSLYRYSSLQFDPTTQLSVDNRYVGTGRFGDVLAGWQFSRGATTVKIFGGIAMMANAATPYDPEARIGGHKTGAKVVAEIWHNWSPRAWTSLDVSDTTANRTYAALLRTGWRIFAAPTSSWSIGPEISQAGNLASTFRRAGLFVRYESLGYEFTLSGGAAANSDSARSGFVAGQFLKRF